MRSIHTKSFVAKLGLSAAVLLWAGAPLAQQQVNLTAGPALATLPDGSAVPMWGYACSPLPAGVTSTATCAALDPAALATTPAGWSPVIITVPTGSDLQINLTNGLTFPTTPVGVPANNIPTSLVIVGQGGGGLGTKATYAPSPTHAIQGTTWPIAGDTSGATFTPPAQGPRVQSFGTEVQAGAGAVALTWTGLRPGTYLLESGTHPSIQGPMGLYGIVVVTSAPTSTAPGTAYPGVSYAADVPLLLSEIDPAQNAAVQAAVGTAGFSETSARVLRDSVSSVTLTVDANGNVVSAGTLYQVGDPVSFVPTTACVVQPVAAVSAVSATGAIRAVTVTNPGRGCTQVPTASVISLAGTGAQVTAALSLSGVMCSDGAAACYPPAVNYTPLYYLVNGVAFDKTNLAKSVFPQPPPATITATGNVLVRLVNAGLRMHVPSIVGAVTGTPPVAGFGLVAEDGNPLPGATRVQSEVFMAAGKTYDVMIAAPQPTVTTAGSVAPAALAVFDRQLSLSANAINRDGGMLAYVAVNGGTPPATAATSTPAQAVADTYNALVAGRTLAVSDPAKGVIANDVNVYGVRLVTQATYGVVTLNVDGTFTYVPAATSTATSDAFGYCANGAPAGTAGLCTKVTLGASSVASSGVTCSQQSFTASTASYLAVHTPGVLAECVDGAGLPVTLVTGSIVSPTGLTVLADPNGGFSATATGPGTYTFSFQAQNALGTSTSAPANVIVTFPPGSNLNVTVLDGADKKTVISDYRWIIEEDRTFYVDPSCTTNPLPSTCPTVTSQGTPAVFGTNFHTSAMPVVARGCTGTLSCEGGQRSLGTPVVCDQGNGICRPDATGNGFAPLSPASVVLDPTKRYYLSILPGDAANPFNAGYAGAPDCSAAGVAAGSCGHGMGGAPIDKGQNAVTVLTQPSPYPPAKLTVFVFEDDFPLNGEHDAGGGVDVLAPNEPGLGGFEITIFDDAGGTGDATGQPTYDMFNMPLSNSLAGTIDPATGKDACPISPVVTSSVLTANGSQKGIIGMVVTCPKYESDGVTLSPLAGQAVIGNLYQGRYGVVATPGADRIARGEEWLQTNTLDGQKAHDSFMRIGEPAYFQEFGPAGYHVTIGFANPKIINARGAAICAAAGSNCSNELKGHVTTARMSRPPDERLYGSGTRDAFAFTQCYASLGDPDGADFAFQKCAADGSFDFTGVPPGNWKLTIFDQWNDQIVDGISTPIGLANQTGATLDMGEVAVHQWQANVYTRTFIDANGNGVSDKDAAGNDLEAGLPLIATNIRFRDGSFSNFNNTDLNGYAGFNEVFPLFSWYTIETDSTRYKTTGVHVVYDTGGPVDGSRPGGTACAGSSTNPCGSSAIAQHYANTYEANPLPPSLSVPGAVYCAEGADCATSAATYQGGGQIQSSTTNHSSGRIDPPFWFGSYGWQGFAGQNSFLEFGKKPFAPGENGGIHGHVVYASTRPFDDPKLLLQTSWEPLVPHVRINLYLEGTAADGITPTLTLVDHTETSSFDDWAQGFRKDAKGNLIRDAAGNAIPNMNCPGQSTTDLYYYSLLNQPMYLDWYNGQHSTPQVAATTVPFNSQFKCYDGMHNWNQLQPAPYDGMYSFPSVTAFNPSNGKPSDTNCTACVPNPDSTDPYRSGTPMLPAGKYVVEVVVPPGYELVKEEDKNILIGDNFIAPVTQQFAGLGNIFILPDQASVGAAYNANNPQNPTNSLGRVSGLPSHEGDTGSVESYWPCVGAPRVVPDFISLYPQSGEVAPFAGATRPLCDRKEVTLTEQSSALAKFYVFTSTHVASHYTGIITDDFTSEFDPFSPQFGEKFAPAYLPVSVKDWTGNEISRTYSDQFGAYNGLSYSTWEVNPPNPTGYGPTMMVVCMNDSGSGTVAPKWDPAAVLAGTTSTTPDPLFQPNYSQFCYELPFMPGQTGYFDTPVVPTSAFSEGYNHPDCNYADATPAIKSVTSSDIAGPWVSQAGHQITITALGDQMVDNYGYSGPSVTTTPFNQKKVLRHYGFGTAGGTVALVGRDGVARPLEAVSWSDTTITGNVPGGLPNCPVTQQSQYGGSRARCGELVITAANGKMSVDTVTITVGGKRPTLLAAGTTIQSAIDAASPGDMIIVPAGTYSELLLMWKPIRLQGVGAASSIVNANTHPAGKILDPWRKQVNCLFGLTPDGRPNPSDTSCSAGWTAASGGPSFPTMIVDRVPMEGILGWDTTVNGNLAEQLIEPGLMGAYEGAAITVLGKGVVIPQGAADAWGSGAEAAFPANSRLLTAADCATGPGRANLYPSNFYCNPSSVDGLGLMNSSQGGGGVFVHAWGHNVQIANNRVSNNTGTLSGGITVGQGEHIEVYLATVPPTTPAIIPPGSCETGTTVNQGLPFCYDMNVNVHHNAVTLNNSIGDELFSSTPAGAGGVSFNNGADYYRFTSNWVCGNMSSGDGGGLAHIGFIKNGDIEHNAIIFNQSTNPTITTNGGGVLVMGAPDPDPICSGATDKDCVPAPGSIPPSDGTGPGLVINANLIMGNAAESGSGGGLRLQHVNGTDVLNFPNGATACPNGAGASCLWNSVVVTNNIIVNNVAGWDGGGVSLQDALAVEMVNNTIASNDSTASSGVLFGSLFAPLASSPGVNCTTNNGSQSCPQVAGLVSLQHSDVFKANLPVTGLSCPPNYGTSTSCANFSSPLLYNNVLWQNRSFFVGVTPPGGTGPTGQQSTVALFESFTGLAAPTQPQADAVAANGTGSIITGGTGACYPYPSGSRLNVWDIGVRGDSGPANHAGGLLAPWYSVLTDAADYPSAHNTGGNPTFLRQYCNGSRVPPELGAMGWQVPPGTNETNALPTPVFTLLPTATVDEGNNWINMRWGPLAIASPVDTAVALGNYGPASTSSAIGLIPITAPIAYAVAPTLDYYGNARKTGGSVDAGAVEFLAGAGVALVAVSPTSLGFGNVAVGLTSATQNLTLRNTGATPFGSIVVAITAPFVRVTTGGFPANAPNCGTSLNAGATCTIKVAYAPTATGAATGQASITGSAIVTGSPVTLTGTGVTPVIRASLAPATWSPTATRGCTLLTCPSQLFVLTNTGNSPLTGVTQGSMTGANATDFPIVRALSTCGPAGGGQLLGQTTLAPGGTCIVAVRFAPPAGDTAGSKTATLSVTDLAGTQSSALTGTAR